MTHFFRVLAICGLLLLEPVHAATSSEALDLAARFPTLHAVCIVKDDGTASETYEWSRTVLKESALDNAKKASVTFSTSAQKGTILAAYTRKADGRRIEVPKDNYQIETNRGREKDSPVYSDMTTMTVVFPEMAVGDTTVFSYRIDDTQPFFPGNYSVARQFSPQVAYDDVHVRIEYPASMWVQYGSHGMQEAPVRMEDGRKILEWTYSNPTPRKSERRNFSVFNSDDQPGYAFSTFHSYADIAAAYGMRARPKAEVTNRVRDLAAQIVGTTTEPRDQAHLLYDWVATNITYAGNCIGIGAVVPRDLDFMLDNKMGDCKDHATLLQALLAARGIRAVQALVNSGSAYRLPKVPTAAQVNHVIDYLPDFNLFVDSTSSDTPFGMLPHGDEDKPVLLVEGFRDGLRTPAGKAEANRQRLVGSWKVGGDGSVTGNLEVTQSGLFGVTMRSWARQMTKDLESDLVKGVLRSSGLIGSGTFEKDDPKALSDAYHYKVSFEASRYVKVPGAGAFAVRPPVNFASSIGELAAGSLEPETDVDVTCMGGTLAEEFRIELPATMKVLSVPDGVKAETSLARYESSYTLEGNVLTVRRTLEDRTQGDVCSPRQTAEFKGLAEKIASDMQEQVLYK